MRDKWKLKDGQLNNYSLYCGYIQRVEDGDIRIDLFHDCCWQVRSHRGSTRYSWEAFDSLVDARMFWFAQGEELLGMSKQEMIEELS